MNEIYRILKEHSKQEDIKSGTEVEVDVDYGAAHDKSMPNIIDKFNELPLTNLKHSDRMMVTVDHYFPAPDFRSRENYLKIRRFCQENNIKLYDKGEGILHQVIAEEYGEKLQDKILIGADGHMCTSAAWGALPFSVKAEEIVKFLKEGKYKLEVPEVIDINLIGKFEHYERNQMTVSGKDIGLYLIKKIGKETIFNKGIILRGSLNNISNSQKMTLGNMLGEVGAKTVYFSNMKADDKSAYQFSAEDIKPQIALPGSVKNIIDIDLINKIKPTLIYIGGCTNGRIDDFEQVVEVLKGKKVKDDISLIISPASRKVLEEMEKRGFTSIIRESGGVIINPGCGACSGIHMGVSSKDDVVITTTPRNTPGRMGDERAQIYLASPRTAALFAVKKR
jgi:homoaconitase/3-isopropylmalate dehydratase large subunit